MTSVKHKFVVAIPDDAADAAAGKIVSSNWNDEHSISFVASDITALLSATWTIDVLVATDATFVHAAFTSTASFAGTVLFGATVSFSATVGFTNITCDNIAVVGTATFADQVIMATSAKVSATLSVGFLQIGGNNFNISLSQSVATGQVLTYNNADNKWRNATPAASSSGKLDGTTGFAGVNFFKMSADWTAYQALELDVQAKGAATTTNLIIALYTDGGTTPILTFATNPIASATASEVAASFQITGTRNQNAMKVIFTRYQMFNGVTNQAGQFPTSTFTTSAINAIGVITGAGTTTTTMSSADIFLYGRGA